MRHLDVARRWAGGAGAGADVHSMAGGRGSAFQQPLVQEAPGLLELGPGRGARLRLLGHGWAGPRPRGTPRLRSGPPGLPGVRGRHAGTVRR